MGDFEEVYLKDLQASEKKSANDVCRFGDYVCEEGVNRSLPTQCELKIRSTDAYNIIKAEEDTKNFETSLKYRESFEDSFETDKIFLEKLLWLEIKVLFDAENKIRICNVAKRRAESELESGKIEDCVFEVGLMLNAIEYIPKQNSLDKIKLRCDAYHIISLAYKQGENYSLAFQYLFKELELAVGSNLVVPKVRTYHQLGELYNIVENLTKTIYCFDRIVSEMSQENIDKLGIEVNSAEDIQYFQDAREWAEKIYFSILKSIRESIITPVIDAIIQYSEEVDLKSFDDNEDDTQNKDI